MALVVVCRWKILTNDRILSNVHSIDLLPHLPASPECARCAGRYCFHHSFPLSDNRFCDTIADEFRYTIIPRSFSVRIKKGRVEKLGLTVVERGRT